MKKRICGVRFSFPVMLEAGGKHQFSVSESQAQLAAACCQQNVTGLCIYV
jgi:hypothetical protein